MMGERAVLAVIALGLVAACGPAPVMSVTGYEVFSDGSGTRGVLDLKLSNRSGAIDYSFCSGRVEALRDGAWFEIEDDSACPLSGWPTLGPGQSADGWVQVPIALSPGTYRARILAQDHFDHRELRSFVVVSDPYELH